MNDELKHYGILGMRWGIRRYQPYPKGKGHKGKFVGKKPSEYKVSGIRGRMAQRKNIKVDKSFKKWEEGSKKRATAIEVGKKANIAKRESERDPKNKILKEKAKALDREYKKALREATTYRKGQVKKAVGSDLSRKYLSEAKQIQKKLASDPTNKALQKQHASLMSKYNVERVKARRAPEVAAKRSQKIASLKAMRTKAIKGAVTSAAIAGGAKFADSYLKSKGHEGISKDSVLKFVNVGKKIFSSAGYFY